MTAGANVGAIYGQMILDTSQYEQALRQMVGLTSSGGKNMEKSIGDLSKRVDELEGKTEKTKGTVGELAKVFTAVGGIVGSGQIIGGMKSLIDVSVQAESQIKGLAAVVKDRLGEQAVPKATAMVARLSSELGLTKEAVTQSMKNLTAMNFTLAQQEKLLRGATDIAVDNRQSHYDLSESVKTWTEGLKNNNSVLSDAIGISENIGAQYKRLGIEGDDLTKKMEGMADRQKLVNDFSSQFAVFSGRAAENLEGWSGATAALNKNNSELSISAGQIIREALLPFAKAAAEATNQILRFSKENPTTFKALTLMTAGFAALVAVLVGGAGLKSAIDLVIPAIRSFGIAMNISLGPIGAVALAIGALITAYNMLEDAQKRFQDQQDTMTEFTGSLALIGGNREGIEDTIRSLEGLQEKLKKTKGLIPKEEFKKLNDELNKTKQGFDKVAEGAGAFGEVFINIKQVEAKIAVLKKLTQSLDDVKKKAEPSKSSGIRRGSGTSKDIVNENKFIQDSLAEYELALEQLQLEQTNFTKAGSFQYQELGRDIEKVKAKIAALKNEYTGQNIDTGMFEGLKQALSKAFPAVKSFLNTTAGLWTQGMLSTLSKGIETYMAMLNAAANVAQVRFQTQVQNLNFLAAYSSKQINDNLEAVNRGLDAEIEAVQRQKEELLRIEEEYQAQLDERKKSEIEKIKARIEEQYQLEAAALQAKYEQDVQNQYDQANNQDVAYANESTLTEEHLTELSDLRNRFNDQEASEIEALNQTLAQESENKKKERVNSEKSLIEQLANLEKQKTANQEASDKRKKEIERDNARLQWVLGMNAFNLQKQAAIVQAKVQMAMMVLDITRAAFQFVPFTLPLLTLLPMAYQAGTMAIQAASMQQYPPPPAIALADGGLVTGGQRGKDSVPAMLMPGELVVPERNFDDVVSAYSGAKRGAGSIVVNITGDMQFYGVVDAQEVAEQVKPILLQEIRSAVEAI